MKHLYAPRYRPPGHATCPPGWSLVERGTAGHFPLRSDLPEGDRPFGVIQYAGPLTEDEIAAFDLEPIGMEMEIRPGADRTVTIRIGSDVRECRIEHDEHGDWLVLNISCRIKIDEHLSKWIGGET